MNPYLASYFRKYDSNFVSYDQMTWFFSFMIIGQGSMIMFGGWLDKRFGPRIGAAVGCSMASAGIFMTYFTIQMSFWPCILTYGLLFGLGVGTAYGPPVFCAMKVIFKIKRKKSFVQYKFQMFVCNRCKMQKLQKCNE